MDNLEPGADNEDFVRPSNSPDELANARARIEVIEGKVKEQVEQYVELPARHVARRG